MRLVWFRRDLRIQDNPALYHACKNAPDGVIALFLMTPREWKQHHVSACQVEFIRQCLVSLRDDLAKLNIPLLAESTSNSVKTLSTVIKAHKVSSVYANREYEVDEHARDAAVVSMSEKLNIKTHFFDDQLLLPFSIRNKQNKPYQVFTPFKKTALQFLSNDANLLKHTPKPKKQKPLTIQASNIPDHAKGFTSKLKADNWKPDEKAAHQQLCRFINNHLFDYKKERDFPALDTTSKLSVYLATGVLSIKQCFTAAIEANQGELFSGNSGALTWMSELIWREFYRHILIDFPHVCKNQPFHAFGNKIRWLNNEKYFDAWCKGDTGIPIIDAAMQQLLQTGWMHNRCRMIVAMFLTKNCLIDWRWGEQFFMEHLIDGDFASNNGGWQWCASTGNDAAPYFRIFNPITQGERFDPDRVFIEKYLGKNPVEKPIVDLKVTRQRAIETFKKAKK